MADEPTLEGRSLVAVPNYYVSQFQALFTPTEAVIVCGQPMPYATPGGPADVMAVQSVMTLRIPPLAAKELMVILREGIENYEREAGTELQSEFLKEKAGK